MTRFSSKRPLHTFDPMLGRFAIARLQRPGLRGAVWSLLAKTEIRPGVGEAVVAVKSWGWKRDMGAAAAAAMAHYKVRADDSVVMEGGAGDAGVQLSEVLADSDPAKHRPSDVEKVYPIQKEELKELFPGGISGAMHLILFGTRSRLPQSKRRGDDWWHIVLKDSPGIVIRREALEITKLLFNASRHGVVKADPKIVTPGYLIDGAPGTGKSTILNHVVHWAVKTGDWLVIYVPHASDLVTGKGFYEREGENGEIILQPAYAVKYLGYFLKMNAEKLSQLTVQFESKEVDIATAITELTGMPLVDREQRAMGLFESVRSFPTHERFVSSDRLEHHMLFV
jgi:hypothetical protein